jgi:hypothetical protein
MVDVATSAHSKIAPSISEYPPSLFILDMGMQNKRRRAMDEVTTILVELGTARVTLRAGLPRQSITIEQAQQLIGKAHEHVVTAIALLRSDKSVSPPANDREAGNLSSRSREDEKRVTPRP